MESEIKFTLCYFAANPSPNSNFPKASRLKIKRFRESFYGIFRTSCVDLQNRSFGLTEPFLWIQLVAEGSLSNWRGLGVAITKARYNFIEGSAFQ